MEAPANQTALQKNPLCSHCGREHPVGTERCPITGDLATLKGPIGTQVDRYQLELLLGAGGFGAVYRAKHVHTLQVVALKTLKRQLSQDPAMVERFLREARAAASVGSEHIVRVMDAGVATDGTAFLAMELLSGFDLQELVGRPADVTRLLELLGQVLEALHAAHQAGIVHRDLKPANVFVLQRKDAGGVERDFVKLLDFGISKIQQGIEVAGGITNAGMAMGTPGYMAPEQFFDARSVDARADIYSVGAMAYQLFSGRLPIEATSMPELIVKVRTEIPSPLATVVPGLPSSVTAAVDKALSRAAGDRWDSAVAFAAALRGGEVAAGTVLPPKPDRIEPIASMLYGATRRPMPAPVAAAPAPAQPAPAPAPIVAAVSATPAVPTAQPAAAAKALGASLWQLATQLMNVAGIRTPRTQRTVAVVWAVALLGIGWTMLGHRGRSRAGGRGDISHWRLANSTCPAGTVPPEVETTVTGSRIVSRSANFPEATGTLRSDGTFKVQSRLGTCTGTSLSEDKVTETCVGLFNFRCELTYQRDD